MPVIKAEVDGQKVTLREAHAVAKFLTKNRRNYKTHEDVEIAFIKFIRDLRSNKNA